MKRKRKVLITVFNSNIISQTSRSLSVKEESDRGKEGGGGGGGEEEKEREGGKKEGK